MLSALALRSKVFGLMAALGLSALSGGCGGGEKVSGAVKVDPAAEAQRNDSIKDYYKKNPPAAPQKAMSREEMIRNAYKK